MTGPTRSVACHDTFERDRAVSIVVQPDRVQLVLPAGQLAALTGEQARRLCDAVQSADSADAAQPLR
ncbi:MAG: hypothetical protein J2O49_09600 [Sciscionella sp.]|nr:hypothetical protein [Sciscionella sp.]